MYIIFLSPEVLAVPHTHTSKRGRLVHAWSPRAETVATHKIEEERTDESSSDVEPVG
jgi:hypothetical protein